MPRRFAAASFLAALLLFLVQPMVARILLPRVGGAATVWTATQLFFQCVLLAGYFLARTLPDRLGTARHGRLHTLALGLAVLALPPGIADTAPPPGDDPTAWLVLSLARGLGAPLVLLAMSAPLLQRWLATRAHDPYPLYAASNAGSLTALVLHPLVLDPYLSLRAQRGLWSLLWVALCVTIALCARDIARPPDLPPGPSVSAPPFSQRARWALLAFAPALLSLGATVAITTDIAPVPLLWTLPLGLYLLSFVLAFRARPWEVSGLTAPFLGLLVVVFLTAAARVSPGPLVSALHLALLFLGALVLHTELARDRPPPAQLGSFYLAIACGGALAGIFASLVAPACFTRVTEYPLAMALVVALLPRPAAPPPGVETRLRDGGVPLLVGIVAYALFTSPALGARENLLRYGVPLAILLVASAGRRPRLALGLVAILVASGFDRATRFEARSFFGVMRVDDDGRARRFFHGTTLHGLAWHDPARNADPTAYYDPRSPIGQVFSALPGTPARIGVVGLGVGMLAAWRRDAQRWTFFELDATVIAVARRWFPWLARCGEACAVVPGDARRTVREDRGAPFDVLVLDAFSSDAIPTHLLTREAFAVWRGHLAPEGIIAAHITNRYVDLTRVLGALARDEGLVARIQRRAVVENEQRIVTTWVILARSARALGRLADDPAWRPLPRDGRAWTDERTDLLRTLRRP